MGKKMRAKIEIEIEEEKDGSLIIRYNGVKIGELGDIKPIDEASDVYDLIKVREKLMNSVKLSDDINKEIQYKLAKLLAWYYTE